MLFDESTSPLRQYLVVIYHGTLILGFNEMGPVNPSEMIFCIICMLLASFFNGLIFSELIMILTTLEAKKRLYSENLTSASSVMEYIMIPWDLQD